MGAKEVLFIHWFNFLLICGNTMHRALNLINGLYEAKGLFYYRKSVGFTNVPSQ